MFVKQNNQCEFAQNEWEGSNLWDLLNVLQIKNPFTELLLFWSSRHRSLDSEQKIPYLPPHNLFRPASGSDEVL